MIEVKFTHCMRRSLVDVDVTADVERESSTVVFRSVLVTAMAEEGDAVDIANQLSMRMRIELETEALDAAEMWRVAS